MANKRFSTGMMLKMTMVFTALASKSAASVLPFFGMAGTDPENDWRQIGKDFATGTPVAALDATVTELVTSAEMGSELEYAIRMSYELVEPGQMAALDKLWTDVIALRGGPEAFSVFLSVRSGLGSTGASAEYYLENWLFNAHHRSDHYDNGGGNGCEGDSPSDQGNDDEPDCD